MTGELTLRGKVLPIGGLKEKLLAAARAGITTAIIPAGNAPELSEIPAHVTAKLTVHPVRTMDEVLAIALARPLGSKRPRRARQAAPAEQAAAASAASRARAPASRSGWLTEKTIAAPRALPGAASVAAPRARPADARAGPSSAASP